MTYQHITKARRKRETRVGSGAKPRRSQTARHPVLDLQAQIGNRAAGQVLQAHVQNRTASESSVSRSRVDGGSDQHGHGGLSPRLQTGLETLSGLDLSAVRVHTNSPNPARLDVSAYAKGHDIHVAPGEERHVPHEAWHVVQQMQHRVSPTSHPEGVALNDNAGLELEAQEMGAKASNMAHVAPARRTKSSPRSIPNATIQGASPVADAVRLIKANSKTTGASMITANLVAGIKQAENMFLKERPLNRWGESLGRSGTVGPGQLGKPAIQSVDKNFSAAAKAFAAIHGAAPSSWKKKATDKKWSDFYIAGYLAFSINDAERVFHPAKRVLSNKDLGVLPLGIAMYHGAFKKIKKMRRRIAKERGIGATQVTWDMVDQELRSGTAKHGEKELEQYTQLVEGSWDFGFDITARLPKSRRFQIQDGKLRISILANYANKTSKSKRGTKFQVRLRRYVVRTSSLGAGGEGYKNYKAFSYVIGRDQWATWTGLPRGDYYLVIEKIENKFSPDHLIGTGTAETMF